MFYGKFSWTSYSYHGDITKMSLEQYYGLRKLPAAQLDELLQDVRKRRWAQFRKQQQYLLWAVGIAVVSLLLAFTIPFFGFIAFCGWVCALSLGFTTASRWFAMCDECNFLTRAHERARASPTYEEFIGEPAKPIPAADVVWEYLVQITRKNRPLIVSWLESAEGYETIDGHFVVYFSRDAETALDSLQRPSNVAALRNFLSVVPLDISLRLSPTSPNPAMQLTASARHALCGRPADSPAQSAPRSACS